jgi:hypothetical protein
VAIDLSAGQTGRPFRDDGSAVVPLIKRVAGPKAGRRLVVGPSLSAAPAVSFLRSALLGGLRDAPGQKTVRGILPG